MILAARFTFTVERNWKKRYFHSKMAWPPATYDVISHNHSNWPSLNLSQNVREGWTSRYWKRQVMMFYLLQKTQKNIGWGGGGGWGGGIHRKPCPYVPPGVYFLNISDTNIIFRNIQYQGVFFPNVLGWILNRCIWSILILLPSLL